MKKINIGIGLLIGLFFVNCSGFLDEAPDNRTKIDSVEKVGEVVTLAYAKGTHFEFANIMSDNAVDSENITLENLSNTEAFFWENIRSESQDSPSFFWFSSYNAISQANTAYESALKLAEDLETKGNTKELRKLKGYMGEALIARAYAHFMLVNIFGKAYDPVTASSDLGVPYMKVVEKELLPKYERNTVQEVYDMIDADIEEGMSLIKYLERSNATSKYHFTLASAKAFATKFYVFKGDFNKALEYSADLKLDGSSLRDYNYYQSVGPDITQVEYAKTETVSNLLVSSVMSGLAYNTGHRYSFTTKAATEYLFSSDSHPYKKSWNYGEYGYTGSKMFIGLGKFNRTFEVTDPTNQTGYRYTNIVLFSNDMLYLDRIEALIGANQLGDALTMINTWVKKHTLDDTASRKVTEKMILDYIPTANTEPFYAANLSSSQKAYLDFLVDLRRRDSHLEGQRWFDVKRFNIEVTHYNIAGSAREEVLKKDDYRRQIQLPDMAISNGLEANPR
ncbi:MULTISPECIES: RagB/SusD family nutrient uptake outer membrane protein [unclassified Myroides]|uniref:RagB/SusD family nutrient uptake outer membrane protein n=1 Tax=unclassified Myroides TaxID=2642485 RepID=UPI003D2F6A51